MDKIVGNIVGVPNPITDYAQNDPTKADYLKNRPFKLLPVGMSIDELTGNGIFLIDDENTLLMISQFANGVDEVTMQDRTGYEQTMIKAEGSAFYRRKEDWGLDWSDWEDAFGSGSGGSGIANEYFKPLPEDADIDNLLEEGRYIINKRTDNIEFTETIIVRKGIMTNFEAQLDWDVIYQVRERFYSSGYEIQQRYYDNGWWSAWEDALSGDSGGATFFESSTPQIDMTVEEEVQRLTISELYGKSLSEYNYTTMRILIENVGLATSGANNELSVNVNEVSSCSLNAPTSFINNSTKQYWGGYINLAENLYLGLTAALGNEGWRQNLQMPVNASKAMNYRKIETIFVRLASPNSMMPIGTKIKIWLK